MNIDRQFLTLERMTVAVGIAGFVGLVGIILLTVVDVTLRYVGADRIPGFDDYGQLFFPIVIAATFPVGMLHARSVTITFLGAGLGPRADRVLNLFGAFLTLTFFALIAWRFIFMTIDMQQSGAVTPTVLMSVVPTWWAATAIMWMVVPIQGWVVWIRLLELVRGEALLPAPKTTTESVM